MKFKLGENVPLELADDLRNLGHEADSVIDEGLAGAADEFLTDRIREEGRILLTLDKGIANIRAYPPEKFAGLVLLRPRATGRGAVLRFARRHLRGLIELEPKGRLLVISDHGIRVR